LTFNAYASRYTAGEEVANSITHGIGAILAIAALATMVGYASPHGEALHIAACSIFGGTLVFAYIASTIYHCIPIPSVKPVLRALDHSAIFVLIAGTYTPFMLIGMQGKSGWLVLLSIWSLAIIGIVLRLISKGRRHKAIVSLYVAMGWIIVLTLKPMSEHVPSEGLELLTAGGFVYMAGIAFYIWRSLPYHHAIWHGFVLLGSALHVFAVLFYLIP
jgi:hemolysin III